MKNEDKTVGYRKTDKKAGKGTQRPIQDERIGRLMERLKVAIGKRSLRSVASSAGISEGTLRNLLSGGTPRLDNILRIADATGVSAAWLATGEGPMSPAGNGEHPQYLSVGEHAQQLEEAIVGMFSLDEIEKAVEVVENQLSLRPSLKLSPRRKAAIITFALEILSFLASEHRLNEAEKKIGKLLDTIAGQDHDQ